MVRSMLASSKLPKKLWAEAISTAVYIRNRCPTKVLPDKTPFEALTGVKPGVGHLKVFGCTAYRHIPKD
uniref:Reverse transcriptase Ty1/copia-type domain-containing protein n=1 Tax=Amphimedon queenslandica TaxID=400682 RepID=A0A1X7UES6_AMPQE